ncbi:MAG: hypothetical protein HON33_03945, partial [Flavobacteriaceae bacterium]|nr:hypothetical protein [Flavobacteriaceae bacterium]
LSKISLMSPEWKVLLKPGLKYTGGNEFFNEKKNIIRKIKKEKESKDGKIYPPDIKHLKEYPDSLFDSVNEFIILASLKTLFDKDQGDIKEFNKKASMLIHPTHLVRETEKNPVTINTFYNWTDQIIETIESRVNGNDYEALEEKYKEVNKDMINLKLFKNFPTFNELKSIIQEIVFDDEVNVHRVIGGVLEKNVKPPWKKYKYNILIGGALLDRGFTIDNLILTYMPRDSKAKNQADTIEQRCRFYGYRKNYIDFCRVYLTEGLKDDYVSYNKTEDYLFETLEKNTMEEFKSLNSLIRLDEKLKPTNLSRIDTELYRTNLSQFKNFNPQFKDHDHNNKLIEDFIELIGNNYDGSRKVLKPKDEYCGKETNNYTHLVSKVSLDDVNNHLLSKFKFNNYEETILRDSYVDLLKEMLKAENKKVYIIEIAPYRDHRPRRIIYKKDDYSNHYKLGVPLYFGGIKKYGAIFADRDLIKNKEKTPSTEIFNYDNEIIIQIHKNISKIKNNEFDATKFYTLAIYNPNKIEGFIRAIES